MCAPHDHLATATAHNHHETVYKQALHRHQGASQPEHALPLLGMLAQAQLSIEDLLGQISKRFIKQLLVLSAEQVAGAKHPGRRSGDVRWHGTQAGQVSLGQAKLKVKRPRLRDGAVARPRARSQRATPVGSYNWFWAASCKSPRRPGPASALCATLAENG